MKGKKPTNKPVVPSPECPVCGLASEAEGQYCPSCAKTHQQIIDIVLHRSIMIRYARIYFYDAVSLYRLWLLAGRRQRLLRRANLIADWLYKNKYKKAKKKRYQDLHLLFVEFVASPLISQAEKKLEEMVKLLEKY